MRHLLRSPSESNVNDVNPWGAQTLNASVINAMQPSIHFFIIQFGGGAYLRTAGNVFTNQKSMGSLSHGLHTGLQISCEYYARTKCCLFVFFRNNRTKTSMLMN